MSHTRVLVSLAIPSFNHGSYIENAIVSVLMQDYAPIELIVVDGGSTDETHAVLGKYSDRLQWTSEPDLGLYYAVNKGWARSQGELLAYLNADDALCSGAIALMADYLQKHPDTALVYGDYYRIDGLGKVLEHVETGDSSLRTLLRRGNTIFTGAMLLRRSVLQEVGWLDANLKYAADYDFCVRVALRSRIGHIRQPLAMFRIHRGSISQNSRWAMWRETLNVSYAYSHHKHLALYSRYWVDRIIHLLPQSTLWTGALVPLRKRLRRLWGLGG